MISSYKVAGVTLDIRWPRDVNFGVFWMLRVQWPNAFPVLKLWMATMITLEIQMRIPHNRMYHWHAVYTVIPLLLWFGPSTMTVT